MSRVGRELKLAKIQRAANNTNDSAEVTELKEYNEDLSVCPYSTSVRSGRNTEPVLLSENAQVFDLQSSFQGSHHQSLRTSFLQRMYRRTSFQPTKEVSDLRYRFRKGRRFERELSLVGIGPTCSTDVTFSHHRSTSSPSIVPFSNS